MYVITIEQEEEEEEEERITKHDNIMKWTIEIHLGLDESISFVKLIVVGKLMHRLHSLLISVTAPLVYICTALTMLPVFPLMNT